jgi:hypothetical protein
MFNGIYFTTRTTTYDTPPDKPNKEKVTNGTRTDPLSTVITPPSRPLQIEKTLYYVHPRAQLESQLLILIHMLLKNTTSLKIWPKHNVLCQLSKFYNIALVNIELS